jgi:nitroreductase
MEFRDVVRRRRMVRNYDPDRPVPPEVRDRLLEHAVRAPSAGFSQGWGFLVLEEPADRDRFWGAATPDTAARDKGASQRGTSEERTGRPSGETVWQQWLTNMRTAPLLIVPHSNKDIYLSRYAEQDKGWTDRDEARWPVPYWDIDAGFASLLMLLTAVDEGLGACFFGIPPERIPAYRAEFGVPDEFTPIGAIAVGYRAPDHRSGSLRRGRRPVAEVTHYGQWRPEQKR